MAQLKNTTIDDIGNLGFPAGTTAQRPASPQQGMIRYNTSLNDTEYYDGEVWRKISDTKVDATGGTIIDTEISGVTYRIHEFRNNGTFNVITGGEVEYLIVAGGGGGGGWGGGGGAGGLLTGFTTVTSQTNYTIIVGNGGARGTAVYTGGGDGGNSSAFGLTAIGGGGGGWYNANNGRTGGSGGGGGGGETSTTTFVSFGGAGTLNQGNAGGRGRGRPGTIYWGAGGGGGAGGLGQDAAIGGKGGDGGIGLASAITGISTFYAGGGGGHTPGQETSVAALFAAGGLGGGGDGGRHSFILAKNANDGNPNTGGGGGGAHGNSGRIGQGGSGIVILRYRKSTDTTTSPSETRISSLPYIYNSDLRATTVRDGLGIDLDSTNLLSYPGAGTTWFDLSGNGRNFTGNASFIDNLNGARSGSAWTCAAGTVANLLNTDYHSIFFTMKFNTTETNTTATTASFDKLFEHAPSGTDRSPGIWRSPNSRSLHWRYDGANSGFDTVVLPLNTWVVIGVTKNGSVGRFYLNAVEVNTTTLTFPKFAGNNAIILFPSYPVNIANISNVMIYNRVLTLSEIRQNYDALRGRYGI
jgi:hypothetical protein